MLERIRQLISKYKTKKKFLNRVALHFGLGSHKYNQIKKAYELARLEFKGKTRLSGEPYFYHKLAVAVLVMEYLHMHEASLIVAALLHDLVEDIKGWKISTLSSLFGTVSAGLVDAVTKPDVLAYGEDMHQFKKAIIRKVRNGGHLAIVLKLADRLHNMITLWGTRKKKLDKTLETLRYFLPLAVEKGILWQELTAACAEQINTEQLLILDQS